MNPGRRGGERMGLDTSRGRTPSSRLAGRRGPTIRTRTWTLRGGSCISSSPCCSDWWSRGLAPGSPSVSACLRPT